MGLEFDAIRIDTNIGLITFVQDGVDLYHLRPFPKQYQPGDTLEITDVKGELPIIVTSGI